MVGLKQEICRVFCHGLSVQEMANGLAISTIYDNFMGDPLGFYALGPDGDGFYQLTDDGTTIPYLEASGASLDSDTRLAAFNEMLNQYNVVYREPEFQLCIERVSVDDIADQALRFLAFLLRVQDLLLMTRERVENAFREDVLEKLRDRFSGRADIKESEAISLTLSDIIPDMVIQANSRYPVAVFIGTTSQKVTDAVLLHTLAMYKHKVAVRVVAVLESESSLPKKFMQRADNHLDAVPRYSKDEIAALDRIEREVFGRETMMGTIH
jgi:hypothetical protein